MGSVVMARPSGVNVNIFDIEAARCLICLSLHGIKFPLSLTKICGLLLRLCQVAEIPLFHFYNAIFSGKIAHVIGLDDDMSGNVRK